MNTNPDEQCLLLKGNLNNKSNMAGATCVAGTAYLTGAPELGVHVTRSSGLYACFVGRCLFFFTFCFGHCVIRYTDTDYSFGISKLFRLYDKLNYKLNDFIIN